MFELHNLPEPPGPPPIKVMRLSDHVDRFKSESDYDDFVGLLEHPNECGGIQLLMSEERLVCATIATDQVQDLLQERMFKRFMESPDLIDEVRRRMEEDEIVD